MHYHEGNSVLGLFADSSDYAPLNSVLLFSAGSTEGDAQCHCVNVTVLQDDAIEGTENFFLRASSVEELSLIVVDSSQSLATVSIVDSASKCDDSISWHYYKYI